MRNRSEATAGLMIIMRKSVPANQEIHYASIPLVFALVSIAFYRNRK
ncbi:MAG: hypothetical protein HFI01_12780 [Lachnospiraceae bacterium]|nr:hypothetical protein [Lachnospiraceae bacterium]